MIFASNHRSFLDPFVIGTIARRPIYYVAKEELFRHRLTAWFLNSLGAFPVRRGAGDADMLETARGDPRPRRRGPDLPRGHAHPPRRARPPQARRRPARARDRRAGRPGRGHRHRGDPQGLADPPAQGPHPRRPPADLPEGRAPSPQLAAAVTDRIWPNVMLQWEWLGGLPPLRRAAVIGAGSWGTAVAVMLARAGLEVDLGCRTPRAGRAARRRAQRALPARRRAARGASTSRASDLELDATTSSCFAVPPPRCPPRSPRTAAQIARAPACSCCRKGLVPPLGTLPTAYVAERVNGLGRRRLGGPRTPRPRSRTAPRSCSPRDHAAFAARSATRSPPPASTSRPPPT